MLAYAQQDSVYVGGENADDSNDGSKEAPVATWEKAKELAASNGTIYVAGTLEVSGDISTNNPEAQVVKRASDFKGNMFEVAGSANFTNIHILGNGEEEKATGTAIAFEKKGAGDALVIGQGVVIEDIASQGSGAAVYVDDAAGAKVTFDGAKFYNNSSDKKGGAVSIVTAPKDGDAQGFTVTITGGTVFDGNRAQDEGGAVYLNGQFVTNIDNATFKNNEAAYGAAIVNYNHYIGNEINIVNGLIANNKTGSAKPGKMTDTGLSAGGVNICMAGAAEVNISSENGVAIFDNEGLKGDIGVWDNSDGSKLKVNEGAMLGGGNHNWEAVGDKGYKANPSEADKAKARNSATVVFENNTSQFHGSIMSNGIIQFGTKLSELRIKKIDANTGEVMGNVVFELTSENGVSRTAETFVETNGEEKYQGVASFTDLPDGKYTLTEKTPAGYRGTMPWAVTIQNGQVTVEDNGQGLVEPIDGQYYGFIISNKPLTPVEISKQALGDDTKELPGAHIVVKDAEGNTVENGDWTSTEESHKLVLEPGEYTLEEVNAPEGFEAITTLIKFTIDEEGKVTVLNAEEIVDGKVSVKDVNHLILEDMPTPVEVEAEKKWLDKDGNEIDWPQGATVTLLLKKVVGD
ncbi:MAG: hypothetical protein IJV62_05290, partial [Eggerthellaceae bacterium]|nr:hypothetical protein [Eggerthellaceae bacterium]